MSREGGGGENKAHLPRVAPKMGGNMTFEILSYKLKNQPLIDGGVALGGTIFDSRLNIFSN